MNNDSWRFDLLLRAMRERLVNARHTVESIDDPGPGKDFISVAMAISHAIDLIDVLIIGRELELEGNRTGGGNPATPSLTPSNNS